MLVIKPYGRSIVANKDVRRLEVSADASKQVIPHFLSTQPEALLAQWISVIDKIVEKPSQKDQLHGPAAKTSPGYELRRKQLEYRSALGSACWDRLKLRFAPLGLTEEQMRNQERRWNWKLHPFGTDPSMFKNDTLKKEDDIFGYWKAALSHKTHAQTAFLIESHLHGCDVRKHDGAERKPLDPKKQPRGLIEKRASSIANSTLADRIEKRLKPKARFEQMLAPKPHVGWSVEDERVFTNYGNLAQDIYKRNIELENPKPSKDGKKRFPSRIRSQEAAKLVFDHYGKQFTDDDGRVLSRREIVDESPRMLALYDAVREYYRVFLKTTQKGGKNADGERRNNLSVVLPKDNAALFALLRNKQNNADVNDLIRLGRVLHYASTEGDSDDFQRGKSWKVLSREELASSEYWTTAGQEDIKRTEAFVRIWRHVISLAARTAKTAIDPKSEALDKDDRSDILSEEIALALIQDRAAQDRISNHLPLLFGQQASLFATVDPKTLVFASLRLIAALRNRAFHFKGRRSFVAGLVRSLSDAQHMLAHGEGKAQFLKAIGDLLARDQANRNDRLFSVIEGAHLHQFMDKAELRAYVKLLTVSAEDQAAEPVALPKFNRLLKRTKNLGSRLFPREKLGFSFPQPGSEVELKAEWRLAKFIGFRIVYEKPFRVWLSSVKGDQLATYVDRVRTSTTMAAQDLHKSDPNKDLLAAKATKLPTPQVSESIAAYFDRLLSFEAGEMRMQNGYESDPEKAREAMEWIHEFRMDIIALAFSDYLVECRQQGKLGALLALGENSARDTKASPPGSWLGDLSVAKSLSGQWMELLYYALHFVPVDDVSQLKHQFDKWRVLEAKGESQVPQGQEEEMRQLLMLYIDMHDAKHTGDGVDWQGLEKFRDLFESPADFDSVFATEGSTAERLAATRRGLREIMRFAHLEPLREAIGRAKIMATDIAKLKELERAPKDRLTDSKIAQAQLKRKKLHEKIMKGKTPEVQDLAAYKECLDVIIAHGELAKKVKLSNHIRLHRIMMSVMSRLVDFSGQWERDGYFICRALMWLQGRLPAEVISDARAASAFRNDGRVPQDAKHIEPGFKALFERFYPLHSQQVRNDMAHFNAMTGSDVDLTNAINDVRNLMSYDRKHKNAVSKSVKDIFFEEGLLVEWQMGKDHRLHSPTVRSRVLQHLTGKVKSRRPSDGAAATEDTLRDASLFRQVHHGSDFVRMVLQLLVPNQPQK